MESDFSFTTPYILDFDIVQDKTSTKCLKQTYACTYGYGALTGGRDTRTRIKELVLLTA